MIKYLFQHKIDKDVQEYSFTMEQFENGELMEFIWNMEEEGYKIIDRIFK